MGVEVLGLLEHVLAPRALVEAGGGDRADGVKAAGLDLLGELDRVAGALDVRDLLALGVGRHVIDGREVEEVVDVAAQALDVFVADAQARLGEVADYGNDAVLGCAPPAAQFLEAPARSLADQHKDGALAFEQALDEVAPDEA